MERLLNKQMKTAYSGEPRKGDVIIYISDNTEISRDLGWNPKVTLERGAETIVRWVSDNSSALLNSGL